MTRGLGGIRKRGRIWWIHYQVEGKTRFESSGSEVREDAVRLLHERNVRPRYGPLRFEGLEEGIITDYELNERRSIVSMRRCMRKLATVFAGDRVDQITPDRIAAYAAARKGEGARPATIRNELAALKRAFNLAAKAGRLAAVPAFPTIEVHNTRTGFFEEKDFRTLMKHLPRHAQPAVAFAYWTGWRRSEILGLEWHQVDRKVGTIRLDWSKNKKGRLLPYRELPELVAIMEQQWKSHEALKRRGRICPSVFHREGEPMKHLRSEWEKACKDAGLLGKYMHDFRRTAARRLVRAGVNEKVAMELLGHKTRSIFDRYNIVNDADLAEGLAKVRDCQETVRDLEKKGGKDRAKRRHGSRK